MAVHFHDTEHPKSRPAPASAIHETDALTVCGRRVRDVMSSATRDNVTCRACLKKSA